MQGIRSLLTRLRAFCLPGGEDAACFIRAVRTTEKGQIRMSPEARWIPFTAEQVTDSTRSSFRWEARLDPGKITSPTVTDAYEDGHGRLTVKRAGIVPVKKIVGPETDRGELQRYLASIVLCPPILLNQETLEWNTLGPLTLRVHHLRDANSASIDINISAEGRPLPAVPIDRVCSASALSPLHGAPLVASFASGKASAYPLSWKFPGIYRKVSSLTTGAKLRRLLRRVERV